MLTPGIILSVLSGYYFIPAQLAILLYFRFFHGLRMSSLLCILSGGVIAWTIGSITKNFFYLPRPYIYYQFTPLVNYLMDGSFPSNHASLSFSLGFGTYLWHRKAGILMLAIAFVVAAGRVVAGVHSIYDVSAGAILGIIVSFVLHRLLRGKLPG